MLFNIFILKNKDIVNRVIYALRDCKIKASSCALFRYYSEESGIRLRDPVYFIACPGTEKLDPVIISPTTRPFLFDNYEWTLINSPKDEKIILIGSIVPAFSIGNFKGIKELMKCEEEIKKII